jgi:hypothetical protein
MESIGGTYGCFNNSDGPGATFFFEFPVLAARARKPRPDLESLYDLIHGTTVPHAELLALAKRSSVLYEQRESLAAALGVDVRTLRDAFP